MAPAPSFCCPTLPPVGPTNIATQPQARMGTSGHKWVCGLRSPRRQRSWQPHWQKNAPRKQCTPSSPDQGSKTPEMQRVTREPES